MESLKWACPKCGAEAHKHGKKDCLSRGLGDCEGLICECDDDGGGPQHGQVFNDPCPNANCYHCGWGGTLPIKPKGLQKWEKQALEAGWTPPDQRKKELGLT